MALTRMVRGIEFIAAPECGGTASKKSEKSRPSYSQGPVTTGSSLTLFYWMNLELAESVVSVLRSGSDPRAACSRLARFCEADWQHTAFWLDASGLTLHLWDALSRHRHTEVLPPSVRTRLRRNRYDNRHRSEAMFAQFAEINTALEAAGIEYAALKGFSLTPDFCPDPSLRFQMDFDYLVRRDAVADVERALQPLGYSLLHRDPNEALFSRGAPQCRQHDALFRPAGAYSLELHYSLFDHREFGLTAPADSLAQRRRVEQFGKSYFALNRPEQLLNRVLNSFQDIFLFAVRLSSLLEIVYFVRRYRDDAPMWQRLRQRAADWDPRLGSMIGLVLALSDEIYACDVPPPLRAWTIDTCPPSALLWVRCYGKHWALQPYPGCKLSMLMARAFMEEGPWWNYAWNNLVPLQLRRRLRGLSSGMPQARRPFGYRAHRAWFHLREAFHVGCAVPSWTRAVRLLPPR